MTQPLIKNDKNTITTTNIIIIMMFTDGKQPLPMFLLFCVLSERGFLFSATRSEVVLRSNRVCLDAEDRRWVKIAGVFL